MKIKTVATLIVAVSLLAACATQKTLEATGGSRADGTVSLSFEYGLFEAPQVNWDQAQNTAKDRCHVWGYSDAQKFGGAVTHCEEMGSSGCILTMVTVNYQCSGHPSS